METIDKLAISTIGGLFFSWLGSVWEFAFFAFVAIILDYITGVLAGCANECLNSQRATKGLYKKVGFITLLCLGFLLDGAFNHLIMRGLSFQVPFDLPSRVDLLWKRKTFTMGICLC